MSKLKSNKELTYNQSMDFGVGRTVCLVLVITIMQDVHVIKLCSLQIKILL